MAGIAILGSFTDAFAGWILWLSGLKLSLASQLAPIRGGAITLFAFILSVLLICERPSRYSYIGMLLILSGVFFVLILG